AYTFKVRAKDNAGNLSAFTSDLTVTTSAPNPCDTDTTVPSAPGALSSPSKTDTSINLSWGAASDNCGVTAYEVYQNGVLKTTVTSTTASITGLTANTTYAFKVRAKDAKNNVGAFNTETSYTTNPTTTATLPGTVTSNGGAIANGTNKSFAVNVTSAGTYRLSIQSTSTVNSRLINVSFNGTNYDLAVDAGQTVIADFPNVTTGAKTIVITAKSDNVVIGTISGTNLTGGNPCDTDAQAPTVPTGLTSPSKTSTSVNLSWTASTDNCGVSA
ncbi:fibronectin type III domain-containing protein, partial [Deinococcus roseus]|uniref:fibronectin type III domain-containing protein n=1 Tax=Deinococcus roseus TaxID=392414 RepID=UPI00166D6624